MRGEVYRHAGCLIRGYRGGYNVWCHSNFVGWSTTLDGAKWMSERETGEA